MDRFGEVIAAAGSSLASRTTPQVVAEVRNPCIFAVNSDAQTPQQARHAAWLPAPLHRTRWMPRLRKLVLGISAQETTFARRGFRASEPATQHRLEHVGKTFLAGYHAALETDDLDQLALWLNATEPEFCGFAFEGAAMGLELLDRLTPWNRHRVESFLEGPAAPHVYMVHVGLGWILARFRLPLEHRLRRLDSLLRWLVVDGIGFHEGFFHFRRYAAAKQFPRRLRGYSRRPFAQGFGRSLWFVEGADVGQIAATISQFPPEALADMWSGVGLACAYAGGANVHVIKLLRALAGSYLPQLAQAAVFAAKARQRARNPAECTELACALFCGISAEQAARIADSALQGLPANENEGEPAYEVWRSRIQAKFAEKRVPI